MMSVGRVLLIVFRWGIFLLACAFLYSRFAGPKGIVTDGALTSLQEMQGSVPLIGGLFVLMFLNWWLEARKWRVLLGPVGPISQLRAFIATIAGTSVGLVSVNRTGDLLGRVLFLAPEHRVAGGFATILGSVAQFLVTLVFGVSGLIGLHFIGAALPWPSGWITWMMITLTVFAMAVALVLFIYPALFRQLLLQLPIIRRLERSSAVLGQYRWFQLLAVIALSASRYLVFTFQFILLLAALGAGVSNHLAVLAIPAIYLISTLIPTVMLTELGVRGSVAIAVLAPLGAADPLVLLATTVLWTLNVALPACVGSVILLFARIRTNTVA